MQKAMLLMMVSTLFNSAALYKGTRVVRPVPCAAFLEYIVLSYDH